MRTHKTKIRVPFRTEDIDRGTCMTKPRHRDNYVAQVTVGLAAVVVILGAVVTPASAKGTKAPKYIGAAPGVVSCSVVSAKVSFSPPLTPKGGGTSPSKVKAQLSGCSTTNAAISIKKAEATGTFAGSPISCATGDTTGVSVSLTITWKAKANGSFGGNTYAGKAAFAITTVNGSNSTGSFAGGASLALTYPPNVVALCSSKHGIKKLALSGSITLGTSSSGTGATAIVGGGQGYCTVLTSGSVDCWGNNGYGELGRGNFSESNSYIPTLVKSVGGIGNLSGVSGIVADSEFSYCALLTSKTVACWGESDFGQLGGNAFTYSGISGSSLPVMVQNVGGGGSLGEVTSLTSNGEDSFCAVLTTGGADCWGSGGDGQLGDNSTATVALPVTVQRVGGGGSLGSVKGIVSGGIDSYCAVLTATGVVCWGEGNDGELGDGSTANSLFPMTVRGVGGSGNLADVSSIFSDEEFSYCAVLTTGGVDCWGDNAYGQLGDDGRDYSATPVTVHGLNNVGNLSDVKDLDGIAYNNYCAVLTTGGVDCWGDNGSQLGNNSTANSPFPVAVQQLGGDVSSLGTTNGAYCALLTTGGVDCWGDNNVGGTTGYSQLGNNSTSVDSPVAVEVSGVGGVGTLSGVASLVPIGYEGFCAVLLNGGVDCWGTSGEGELAQDPLYGAGSLAPVAVIGLG